MLRNGDSYGERAGLLEIWYFCLIIRGGSYFVHDYCQYTTLRNIWSAGNRGCAVTWHLFSMWISFGNTFKFSSYLCTKLVINAEINPKYIEGLELKLRYFKPFQRINKFKIMLAYMCGSSAFFLFLYCRKIRTIESNREFNTK